MENWVQSIEQIEQKIPATALAKWYDRYINLKLTSDDELVCLGEIMPIDDGAFVRYVMEEWVSIQDPYIKQLRNEGKDPFILAVAFSQRGITYEEFKYVMSGKRPKDYKNDNAFFYLHIINEEVHDRFIATIKDEDKNDMDLYLERIKEITEIEIPVLQSFFFSYRKKYFPYSSLQLHTYILGGTGSGKSEVFKYLHYNLWKDSQKGKNGKKRTKSLISLEPHGKLSRELLQFNLLENDPERVLYLDAFLRETAKRMCGYDVLEDDYTFVFNPFDLPDKSPNNINFVTQELSAAFFEILKSEASVQMTALIRACIGTLLNNEGMSIADLKRFMDDNNNFDLIQKGLKSPNKAYRELMSGFDNKSLNPTKNGIFYRLQNLTDDIHLRLILMGKSTIDIEKEMNEGKVVICNLSKGLMGKESAPMLGKLLVALIQGYALKRERSDFKKDTFLFMDEMQNYISPSIEEILTESRKYGLYMVMANQFLGQKMDGQMKRTILANTAIKFCGDNDPLSLKDMAEMMALKLKDFDKLKKYHFYAYNKQQKALGARMVKMPSMLVRVKEPYYASKKVLRDYFLWLAHDSGYYVKKSVLREKQKKKEDSKSNVSERNRAGGDGVYENDFID